MKQKKIFIAIIVLASLLFFACNGNNGNANTGKDSVESNTSTATASSSDDASYYCKIDGKVFSGKGTNGFVNTAFATTPDITNFVLMSVVAVQQGVPAQFAFHVANKGTTTVHGTDNSNYSVKYSPENSVDYDYQSKEMTVTITSSGGSRFTGTFSGTLIVPRTDSVVPVTDGRFDIPYSLYSKK